MALSVSCLCHAPTLGAQRNPFPFNSARVSASGKLVAFKGLWAASVTGSHGRLQLPNLFRGKEGTAVQCVVFPIIGVDFFHNELGAFQTVQLFLQLLYGRRVVGTDPAHARTLDLL